MGRNVFRNDEEYLDESFKICDLFLQKFSVLERLSSPGRMSAEEGEYLQEKVQRLNLTLTKMDCDFKKKLLRSRKAGKAFIVEEIVSRFGFDEFERKVVMLFLYVELSRAGDGSLSGSQILNIFDMEGSATWRLKNARHFGQDKPLFKHRFLLKERGYRPGMESGDYRAGSRIVGMMSRMLNGEKVEWEGAVRDGVPAPCDEVGSVKVPEFKMDDVVLPAEEKEKVEFMLAAADAKDPALAGLFKSARKGKGTIFLFYGPPGTGKSMLAEAIAAKLKKKILIVEYPKILNLFMGQTDKNISRMFSAAKENDAVLCLDEADSLLYDRGSYAGWEHDIRFVNEVLQELERFDGVAVLTTNMDTLLDPALERRVSLKVKFDLPDEALRSKIWKANMPSGVKIAPDIDFDALARGYEFAGGYIKNAVMNALRKVALRKEDTVTMSDLVFGADMEKDGMYRKENVRKVKGFKV